MADFNFLLPSGALSPDGGGAYVTNLVAALRAAGHGVWFGDGPGAAVRVIDGMAIAEVAPDVLAGAIGLIHHPSAMAKADQHEAVQAAERERLPALRRLVATSDAVGERLVGEYGVAASDVTVIRPGVPNAPRSAGSGGPECAILSIGALVPRKGHAVLLAALARLFDLPWRLAIVGDAARDPAYAASLQAQAAEAGCKERVQFAGTLDAGSLDAAWRSADIFALATEWEGYCAPVAEALRRGVPVAITTGGSAAELVTPEAGVVCTPGDVVTLSKSLRRLIFDTPLRADMAEAAWQIGQTLPDWTARAAQFVEATKCS